jgi:hypothetical protein
MRNRVWLFLVLMGLMAFPLNQRRAEGKPKVVQMDAALRAKLDKFFSNFTEACLGPFQRNDVDDEFLIAYGIAYITQNKRQVIENGERVAAREVAASASYFFGRDIKRHRSIRDYPYKAGFYNLDNWTEREIPVFSRLQQLTDLGHGSYSALVANYSGRPGDKDDPVRLDNRVKATIRQVTSGEKRRFILLDYKIIYTPAR